MDNKKKVCQNCEYLDSEWFEDDDGDEFEEFYCARVKIEKYEHIIEEPCCHTCMNFSERPAPEPYKEKFTKCDSCGLFDSCYKQGILLNATDIMDSSQHFIISPWGRCAKEVQF